MHEVDGEQWGPPITRLSDERWQKVQPLLEAYDPLPRVGRKRVNPRGVLEAILYRQHNGCSWNSLPKEYPDDSTVHRTYQRWRRLGILDQLLDTLGEGPSSGHGTGSEPS
jgi:putative transposase